MRFIINDLHKRWPGGCIVYQLIRHNYPSENEALKSLWAYAIQEWSRIGTDLRFVKRTTQELCGYGETRPLL
jgi:hypothetical protein